MLDTCCKVLAHSNHCKRTWTLRTYLNLHCYCYSLHFTGDLPFVFQAPGFANALSVLSHVEFTLMSSTGEEESDRDVYPGVVCSSSTPILKWLQDPGVLSVEKTDPVSIAQAEKDLRWDPNVVYWARVKHKTIGIKLARPAGARGASFYLISC